MKWMDLRYPGTCKVCRKQLESGTRAFYDKVNKTVTCTSTDCAEADGLVKEEWIGSPTSGRYVRTLAENRVGPAAPIPAKTTASRPYSNRATTSPTPAMASAPAATLDAEPIDVGGIPREAVLRCSCCGHITDPHPCKEES